MTYDAASQGRLDRDVIPSTHGSGWVENIYFPLDGSAPRGTYSVEVDPYRTHGEMDFWSLTVYLGDNYAAGWNGVGSGNYAFTFE